MKKKTVEKNVYRSKEVLSCMILNEILFSSSSSLSNTLVRRFVFYGSKLVGEDVYVGDKYDDMKDESILIGKYDPRTPQGNREGKDMGYEDILLMRYYIYKPISYEEFYQSIHKKMN